MASNSSSQFHDLPKDVLLTICDHALPDTILSLSLCSTFWNTFCRNTVWPRRIATSLGVAAIQVTNYSDEFPFSPLIGPIFHPPTTFGWHRILQNFNTHSSARHLCLCVQLGSSDSITSLALRFAVSKQDICIINCLFAEHQVSSRTHLYIPLLTEQAVLTYTGQPTSKQIPLLIQDTILAKRYFAVVKCLSSPDTPTSTLGSSSSKQSYVRQLLVKLIARGLSVHQDEVRFYLEDADFDVPKAYKKLIEDHRFSP